MEPAQQILSRIKDFGASHGVDFEGELLRYDYKKTGVISTVSFHRWIATLGVQLSNRNVQTLILAYQKGDGVDVFRLVEDLKRSASFTATMHAKPPQCPAELADLARELARRRQTLREVLAPYDHMNSGRVNTNNFYRALGASPVTRTIANAYAVRDEIDYLKLGDDVKLTGRTVDLRHVDVPAPTPAFIELGSFIKSRKVDARLVFSQQDKLNTGGMQRGQFYATLSSFGANLSPAALKEIADSFDEGNGTVNYFLFLQALDEFVPPPPKATTKTFVIPEELVKARDPQEILEAARRTIVSRRIDVDAHFQCLEREGAGEEVPLARFARVLIGMKIDLSNDDMEAIAGLFRGVNGTVRWREFVAAVKPQLRTQEINVEDVVERLKKYMLGSHITFQDSAARFDREASGNISGNQLMGAFKFIGFDYTMPELSALRARFPGSIPGSIDWKALSREVDVKKGFGQSQEDLDLEKAEKEQGTAPPEGVAAVIEKISKGAECREIRLFEEFRLSDKARKGTVSQETFLGLLNALPVKFTQAETRAVLMFYRVSGCSDVNYINLCKDLNALAVKRDEDQRQRTIEAQMKPSEPVVEIPPAVHEFIRKFKTFSEQMRITPVDMFVPYDIAHNGTLPGFRIQACFNNFNYPVTREDTDKLMSCFSDARKPEYFNYVAFLDALKREDITSQEVRAVLESAPISHEVEREALITCSQIREKLLARHRTIDLAFTGLQEPAIPYQEFQARLAKMDLVLRAGQTQSLIRKYRVNLSDLVDWKTFCADVNNSRTIGF